MAVRPAQPFRAVPPTRSPQATARLAWLILGLASGCFLFFCVLSGTGLWYLRASIAGAQAGSMLESYSSAVSRIYAGEVRPIAVFPGQTVPLEEGETVRVGPSAPPGTAALVTLWEGSTLQLYAGTQVTFRRLQATLYSERFREVVLEIPAGQVLLGVARTGSYQEVRFVVYTPAARIELAAGGNYLLRVDRGTEVAVRLGEVLLFAEPQGPPVQVPAGQKAVVASGLLPQVEPARWQLLRNGDFAQGLAYWTFRSEQTADGGTVEATYLLDQQMVGEAWTWTLGLSRMGGTEDRCIAILSQEIGTDLSPYQSVRLEFDLRIDYQSQPGGGPLGIDYPFNVAVRYHDAQGENRRYTFGFYDHTARGSKTDFPGTEGEARMVPHYRWTHISLELLELYPRPVFLDGIELLASGNDYKAWVANVSLSAQ
ncbi:MAG: hypothetical protein ACP5OO_02795 [Chloroflexia bacterium]